MGAIYAGDCGLSWGMLGNIAFPEFSGASNSGSGRVGKERGGIPAFMEIPGGGCRAFETSTSGIT